MPNENKRTYLGDGVYAEFDGSDIKLITTDGTRDLDVIYLDAEVFQSLVGYGEKMFAGKRS